jgi:hypothetical protein
MAGATPLAVITPSSMAFPMTFCAPTPSQAPLPQLVTVTNNGTAALVVAAKVIGSVFTVSPTSLTVPSGMTATLAVNVIIPGSAVAGAVAQGFLGLFTNDPANANVTIPLTATPSGANLVVMAPSPSSFAFPASKVGAPAPTQQITFVNNGNAPGSFAISAGANPDFSITKDTTSSGVLMPGQTWTVSANFTASMSGKATSQAAFTPDANYPECGGDLPTISLSGEGVTGSLAGWPTAPIDFGAVNCGGAAGPAAKSFTLTNSGTLDAQLTSVKLSGAPGFGTDATVGSVVPAKGSKTFQLTAPPVPVNAPLTAINSTLTFESDADNSAPHAIRMSEEPSGATIKFDPATTPVDFGSVALFKATTKTFNVVNTGAGQATVTLSVLPGGSGDAGVDGAADGGRSPFAIGTPTVTLTATGTTQSTQPVDITFTPPSLDAFTGQIALTATGTVCGTLPAPIAVTGSGKGLGPTVVPNSVTLTPTCGGPAPQAQTFLVRNDGMTNFTWSLSLGPGVGMGFASDGGTVASTDGSVDAMADAGAMDAAAAADAAPPPLFNISANPPPGLLMPGQASTVTVTSPPIPLAAGDVDPAAYAAAVTITTDVPLDPPHIVTLGQTPLGDQLTLSIPNPLRFGQVPITTTMAQTFTVSNSANPGSPAANVTLVVVGSDAGVYSVAPATIASLGPGATSGSETVNFAPTSPVPYPATLTLQTTDPVCTALPTIQVSGTGTNGSVKLSTTNLAFGSNPNDAAGHVTCGETGATQTFTVTNIGNQAFNIKALTLGKGATSPFLPPTASAMSLGIGAPPATITVAPRAIPATVADPSDATQFADTLTITTDITGETPTVVNLAMQARGAVIANVSIPTAWAFGTVSYGSIGTFTSTLQNTGNAPVSVSLTGLAQPTIFALQGDPLTVPGTLSGAYTSLTGEFIPPSANGSWGDRGALVMTAPEGFCGAPPMGWTTAAPPDGGATAQPQWVGPTVQLSGSSNSSPPVTISGSLAFQPTECGGSAPSGMGVVLTNNTNVTYSYKAVFGSGKYYGLTAGGSADAGTGTLAPGGTATIVVHPVMPAAGDGGVGSGITPGSAPYADNLLVTVEGADAGSPIATFNVPISWTLNGAVLVLPQGAGPNTDEMGTHYYPADTVSGYTLPMQNTGNENATVTVVAEPQMGAFTPVPATIQLNPGHLTGPTLNSLATNACVDPDGGAPPPLTVGTASFFISSGSVCQFFPMPKVTVESCSGTLTSP